MFPLKNHWPSLEFHRYVPTLCKVSEIRSNLLRNADLSAISKLQLQMLRSRDSASRNEMAIRLAGMYDIDKLDTLLSAAKCAKCGAAAKSRCSSCKNEWYCSRQCQVRSWSAHKEICKLIK